MNLTGEPIVCSIFCGPGSAQIVRLALYVYRSAGLPLQFELVTPVRCRDDVAPIAQHFGTALLMDEQVEGHGRVAGFLLEHKDLLGARGRSVSWYLQQYLKIARTWRGNGPAFVHDGDTIFQPGLLAQMARQPFLMTTRENIAAYTRAAARMHLPTYPKSFVANGGIFLPDALQDLGTDPATWFVDAMKTVVLPASDGADFSEYQIMGALLAKRMPVKPLKIFRRFDLLVSNLADDRALRRIAQALSRYEAIAFEAFHSATWVKRLAGELAYGCRYSW